MANFKTRARALDLLGRQQIAGIPTAINELLKNAHDAYADKVDVDYFRKDKLLILRDDGVGMSKKDFETRWLTLGTESKLANSKMSPPPIDKTKPYRVPMGEKGIGRLAIASIGEQVLIISKAKNEKIVAAFINWTVFELPGLNLEDIVVPIREFDSLPSNVDLELMKRELLDSIEELRLKEEVSNEVASSISETIKEFEISPSEIENKLVIPYELEKESNSGTFFYVSPVDSILSSDIDGSKKGGEATKIEKMLIGFHNTMTPNHPKPVLDISFRDYRGDDETYEDIIDEEHFFTVKDFELADHHFKGKFDEYGQFKGLIKVYGEEGVFDHIVNWSGNNFKETSCGEFEINLAYVQGNKRDSIIDSENYNRITSKSDKFGGLYIYKDNIRVLPYGDSDYDYLDIEKNRTKRASTHFFSYRRMFGVINITQKENFRLKEKAGREGFIENKAYRQLQAILKNFFLQLAADFFRDDNTAGPKAELWVSKRRELQRAHLALEKRAKQAKIRKEKFEKSLDKFFVELNEGKFQFDVENILDRGVRDFKSISTIEDHDMATQRLLDVELDLRKELSNYKNKLSIPMPKGFVIKKSVRADYETYLDEFNKLDGVLFEEASKLIDVHVNDTIKVLDLELSKRKRLEQAVDFISTEAKKVNNRKKKDVNEAVSDISKRVRELTTDLMIDLDDQIKRVKDRFKELPVSGKEDFDLVGKRRELENEINSVSDRNALIFDTVIRQLEGIYWSKDGDDGIVTNEEIADALGEELDSLREQLHTDIELSQLGLAVGVINHEFSSTIKSVRSSLKDLKAWSEVNEKLEGVYKNIKINFEHLDGYLNLFTPLNRRLQRRKEEIKAIEIKTFLIDLFKARLERHNISFKHTKGFAKAKLFGYRSTFYPVFVNLMDNAIHWLNESDNVEEKVIRLHSDGEVIYFSNNGPAIKIQDEDKIFSLRFSRKDNGRGMGLHISKEVLNAANYDIVLAPPRKNSTVTFKIEKIKEKENE